ncbi:hypothetical protein PPL_09934 [Heterostelium album PN500]|uniref:Uncharacterized protein n=1 Tax=Heterostelium pallidum (strain ATCC 26659 / Pp 5 / PN500) TaxID=670386 RepID=D3BPR7_HETP5|nr:hypothetical protein PPL_09934 [Heterostelium album PN500]EFA76629.1 hypothetical protein PPL_09934 [Heterostelium album PN500]|eukprot:XP_020428761.1 hypothetical protein PPL_09934 [Heterostelium album PN500]
MIDMINVDVTPVNALFSFSGSSAPGQATRLELDEAFNEIQNCNYLHNQYPLLFSDFGDTVVHTLSSIYQQTLGNHIQSKQHITIALNKSTRFDMQILSIIRMVINTLHMNEIDTAKKLINDYLLQLENHPQLVFKVATLFLDGDSNNPLENSNNLKTMLESAITLSTVSSDFVSLCCCYDSSSQPDSTQKQASLMIKRHNIITNTVSKEDQQLFFQSLISNSAAAANSTKSPNNK